MEVSRTERLNRRTRQIFESQWGEELPSSLDALGRRSRHHFWHANNLYMSQCMTEFRMLGGIHTGPIKNCLICYMHGPTCTTPCGHNLCNRCTSNMITMSACHRTPFRCPFCRAEYTIEEHRRRSLVHKNSVYLSETVRNYNFYEEAYFLIVGHYPLR